MAKPKKRKVPRGKPMSSYDANVIEAELQKAILSEPSGVKLKYANEDAPHHLLGMLPCIFNKIIDV